jgi:tol-pal system protein YbgF
MAMRPPVRLGLVLLLALGPESMALAQTPPSDPRALDRRVTTLEGQMRAVQRQVFPGGDPRFFAPDTPPEPQATTPQPGSPAGAPLIDLQARVEALETQQRALTGQVEELGFRLRQLQDNQTRARADMEFRLDALEGKRAPAAGPGPAAAAGRAPLEPEPQASVPAAPGRSASATTSGAAPATGPEKRATTGQATAEELEARYREAFALYEARDYAAAAPALEAFAKANPSHPRASNAQYWAGRAVMAQGRPADAAKLFLAGYQQFPRGQRAAESLLWLGKALVDMKQPKAACQALDQLRTAYPERLTGTIAAEATRARAAASCAP